MSAQQELYGLLEPEAEQMARQLHGLALSGQKLGDAATVSPMLTSIAISLKRLADVEEAAASHAFHYKPPKRGDER